MYNYIKKYQSGWKACMWTLFVCPFLIFILYLYYHSQQKQMKLLCFWKYHRFLFFFFYLLESTAGWYVGHCSSVGFWWKLIIEALQPQDTAVHPPLERNYSLWSQVIFVCVRLSKDWWYLCNMSGSENYYGNANTSPFNVHHDMGWSSSSYCMSKYFLHSGLNLGMAMWVCHLVGPTLWFRLKYLNFWMCCY